MSDESSIGLAELIQQVKEELLTQAPDGEKDIPIFAVDSVELELQVTVKKLGKAGRSIHRGRRPTVRGLVMNPNDHPHGGGEGKTGVGMKHPKTPWGKPALGNTKIFVSAIFAKSFNHGRICFAPKAQFKPTAAILACLIECQNASTV